MIDIDEKTKREIIRFQIDEISASEIYSRLALLEKDIANKKVLENIAEEESCHYDALRKFSGESVKANKLKVWFFIKCARILGLTFGLKLMELAERSGSADYRVYEYIPELKKMAQEEDAHEERLINMINEERLEYMGSVVLGLNDALVEFTGALAGFTLALGDAKLIALTGSITGIAAALSMASSEYLSTKSEAAEGKHPVKAAIYTGIAYIITVAVLVAPFVFLKNVLLALGIMLFMALVIIAIFNFYYSVARSESFKKRFLEMAILSFTVAGISFFIGYLLKTFTGISA
jgi:VIT1/CCC1 family predicted Fe2+/Mn2+ transporter